MTTLSEVSTKIQTARAELREFAKTQGAEAIGAAFKPFFAAFPDAADIRWTQYTPHFNDGDACTFSVHEPEIRDENGDKFSNYGSDKPPEGMLDAFDTIWSTVDDELLEYAFGDGYEITITSEGVTVEEYDHD